MKLQKGVRTWYEQEKKQWRFLNHTFHKNQLHTGFTGLGTTVLAHHYLILSAENTGGHNGEKLCQMESAVARNDLACRDFKPVNIFILVNYDRHALK